MKQLEVFIMSKLTGACIIGQSGGPTSVINASAYGAMKAALEADCITKVYGAEHGIKGVLIRARFLPLQARRSRRGRHRL